MSVIESMHALPHPPYENVVAPSPLHDPVDGNVSYSAPIAPYWTNVGSGNWNGPPTVNEAQGPTP